MFNSSRSAMCPEIQLKAICQKLTIATGAVTPVIIAILLVGCAKPPPEPVSVAKPTETTRESTSEATTEAAAEIPAEADGVEEPAESASEPPAETPVEVAADEDAELVEEPIVLTAKLFGMTREELAAKNLTVESARELLAASERPQPSECESQP
jgi:hypothetical protein